MKLQNTSHTTKGNCMPKLTIASLVCINRSCNGGHRDDLTVQLGASTLISSAPSPEAQARHWVVRTSARSPGAEEAYGVAPSSVFPRDRNARFRVATFKNISCCSLYLHEAPDAASLH